MRNFTFLSIACAFALCSCTQQTHTGTTVFTLANFENVQDSLSFENSTINYIPLEMNGPQSTVARIDKICKSKEYLFILSDNHLLQFGINGKFIRQIATEGRGPMEHLSVIDITIDESAQRVYIVDVQQVLEFDFDGKSIKQYPNITMCWKFAAIGNTFIINPLNFLGNAPYKLLTLDKNTADTLAKHKNHHLYTPKNGYSPLRPIHSSLMSYNGEVVFHQQYSDTVYNYNPSNYTLTPRYIFDFQHKKITQETLINDFEAFEKVYYVMEMYDTPQYLHLILNQDHLQKYYVVDKQTKQAYRARIKIEHNWYFYPISQYNNQLIGFISPENDTENYIIVTVE